MAVGPNGVLIINQPVLCNFVFPLPISIIYDRWKSGIGPAWQRSALSEDFYTSLVFQSSGFRALFV